MAPNRNRPEIPLLESEELPYALLLSDMPPGTEGVDDLVVQSAIFVSKCRGGTDIDVAREAVMVYADAVPPPTLSFSQPFVCPTREQRREMAKRFFPNWNGVEKRAEYADELGFNQDAVDRMFTPAIFLGKPTEFGDTSPHEGECLFAALSFWLTGDPLNHSLVRDRLASHIRAHPDSVPRSAMRHELSGAKVAHDPDEPLDSLANKYSDLVARAGQWGGDELLGVFGHLAQCNVWMYVQAVDGSPGLNTHLQSWQLCGELKPDAPSIFVVHRPAINHWSSVVRVRSY
ncbi:OTU-like cysteine protease [Toxoplasma gondii TgCatPRC2]|uniref:OTU-like cysteine protease n=1 Tax=Toxoplasma gondii TgCatPRC2 TaxID=1130821 RepID=A0A151H6I4_TOXGO|nr:OTU-like cysteine protease [Toxoplasma gondii TgCatPRC2]